MLKNSAGMEIGMNNKNIPEGKAKQILDAVMKLYNKGMDFYVMKISDIADEAGIGKGTVYEYFSNKDEIIREAVIFALRQDIDRVCHNINSHDTFDEMFDTAIAAIEENVEKNRAMVLLIIRSMFESDNDLMQSFVKEVLSLDYYNDVIKHFIEVGVQEKCIRQPANELEIMMAVNVIVFYAQYYIRYCNCNEEIHASRDEAKEYCKKMLIRVLND